MTNPTTPFSWQMPTSTDLVTDLPADFETFGQAVATSMADLLGGTTGQILSKASNTDMDFTWTSANPGDITGVTAGTGISGGGTSGDVTITNSMATAIDAKGDLIGGTGADTFSRLAVGTNGQVLTADSTAATGLAWATPSGGTNLFYAGKNKIINGDFGIWQRGTSISTGNSDYYYGPDRWASYFYGANTTTMSQQTFTPGAAPVSGYESQFFARFSSTNTSTAFRQSIEDVRTFAGQTVTVSFWAKAASAITLSTSYTQNFGTGGSTAVDFGSTNHSITTSWVRYSATTNVPSISGKTIGTNSSLRLIFFGSGVINTNIDIWGVQLEAGSSATNFITASGGSPQAELAMCQRYFISNGQVITWQGNVTNAQLYIQTVTFPVQMRTAPTITPTSYSASNFNSATLGSGTITVGGFLMNETANATASGAYYQATYTASAEL